MERMEKMKLIYHDIRSIIYSKKKMGTVKVGWKMVRVIIEEKKLIYHH
jgi:hypothetical protein